MKHIDENIKILEICEKYPETLDFFESKGINLKDGNIKKMLGSLSLKNLLLTKKINITTFVEMLDEYIEQYKNSGDISIKRNESQDKIKVMGLLPCPIRIPLLEGVNNFLQNNSNIEVEYELKAASAGLDWLKNDVIGANDPKKLADIFISAGFDLFFEDELMGKFKKEHIFKDITGIEKYNLDFKDLKDPDGDYSMLGVVPAIFLVNQDMLKGRKIPTSWRELLSGDFKKSVSLPISDFDLFNSILIHINKEFGKEGVENLRESLLQNLHPAQMVKSDKLREDVPTVTIMPYFFTKMIGKNSPMIPIWPSDGAIISPIFMLSKDSKNKDLKKVVDFFASQEVGEIFSHKGLFPSVNPDVDNNLDGKKFMWCGWEYIHQNDIGKILKEIKDIFFESSNKSI